MRILVEVAGVLLGIFLAVRSGSLSDMYRVCLTRFCGGQDPYVYQNGPTPEATDIAMAATIRLLGICLTLGAGIAFARTAFFPN
jgi:hypothetical protein